MPEQPNQPQNPPQTPQQNPPQAPQMSGPEQIGYHKGALSTLAKERQELARLLQIVEQLMQMHVASLKELGVDLEKEAQQQSSGQGGGQGDQGGQPGSNKPIEDLLR